MNNFNIHPEIVNFWEDTKILGTNCEVEVRQSPWGQIVEFSSPQSTWEMGKPYISPIYQKHIPLIRQRPSNIFSSFRRDSVLGVVFVITVHQPFSHHFECQSIEDDPEIGIDLLSDVILKKPSYENINSDIKVANRKSACLTFFKKVHEEFGAILSGRICSSFYFKTSKVPPRDVAHRLADEALEIMRTHYELGPEGKTVDITRPIFREAARNRGLFTLGN